MSMRVHKRIFLEANGDGPWVCYLPGCDEFVHKDALTVHHIDEDHANNAVENLTAMHHACHSSLHHAGKIVSDETRAKIAETRRGVSRTVETRAKIGNWFRGRQLSDEHRQKISDAQLGKPRRPESVEKMRITKRGVPWSPARRAAQEAKKERMT